MLKFYTEIILILAIQKLHWTGAYFNSSPPENATETTQGAKYPNEIIRREEIQVERKYFSLTINSLDTTAQPQKTIQCNEVTTVDNVKDIQISISENLRTLNSQTAPKPAVEQCHCFLQTLEQEAFLTVSDRKHWTSQESEKIDASKQNDYYIKSQLPKTAGNKQKQPKYHVIIDEESLQLYDVFGNHFLFHNPSEKVLVFEGGKVSMQCMRHSLRPTGSIQGDGGVTSSEDIFPSKCNTSTESNDSHHFSHYFLVAITLILSCAFNLIIILVVVLLLKKAASRKKKRATKEYIRRRANSGSGRWHNAITRGQSFELPAGIYDHRENQENYTPLIIPVTQAELTQIPPMNGGSGLNLSTSFNDTLPATTIAMTPIITENGGPVTAGVSLSNKSKPPVMIPLRKNNNGDLYTIQEEKSASPLIKARSSTNDKCKNIVPPSSQQLNNSDTSPSVSHHHQKDISPATDDSKLDASKLNDSKLDDSKLNDSKLNDSTLNDSSLDDSKLNDSKLNDSSLNDSKLNGSSLDDSKLKELNEDSTSNSYDYIQEDFGKQPQEENNNKNSVATDSAAVKRLSSHKYLQLLKDGDD